jgi:hypothetical protein
MRLNLLRRSWVPATYARNNRSQNSQYHDGQGSEKKFLPGDWLSVLRFKRFRSRVSTPTLSDVALEALIDKTVANIGWLNEHSSP